MMYSLPIAIVSLSLAAQAAPATDTSGDRAINQDQKFIQMAVASGMAEVKLGQMALQQATAADVKQFARHMVEDHAKANKELEALLGKKQFRAPRELGQTQRRLAD